jgi:hypothetical protein
MTNWDIEKLFGIAETRKPRRGEDSASFRCDPRLRYRTYSFLGDEAFEARSADVQRAKPALEASR